MKDESNLSLFDKEGLEFWKEHWNGMLEYKQDDATAKQSIIVHFKTDKDRIDFGKLVNQKLTYKTQSIWFPKVDPTPVEHLRWISKNDLKEEISEDTEELEKELKILQEEDIIKRSVPIRDCTGIKHNPGEILFE